MIDTGHIKSTLIKAEKLADIYGNTLNLGFSGGKDSVVLKYFADYYGIKYVANFNNTQIEQYKGMVTFIRDNYPDVNILSPDREHSFFELMKRHGLPSIFRRWCCEKLKHSSYLTSHYNVNIMGVRAVESRKRAERGAISVFGKSKRAEVTKEKLIKTFASELTEMKCEGGKDKINIYPIFDLSNKDVWSIINTEHLTVPPTYASGYKRIGCAFCPFAKANENIKTIQTNPNIAKAWLRVMDELVSKYYSKRYIESIDAIDLFYLYTHSMLNRKSDISKGLSYLHDRNLFGITFKQQWIEYLIDNKSMPNELIYK